MLHLLGTHGTSRTRATSICCSRTFVISQQGRIGCGAYFWAYESVVEYGIQLAEAWWKLAKKKNAYAGDADDSCTVLRVVIKKPEDLNYLDSTEAWFQEALFKSINLRSMNDGDTPEITAFLIDQIQDEKATSYHVVKARVATPPLVKNQKLNAAQKLSKMSNSYIVKKHGLHLIEEIDILTQGEKK
nr:hypothetical protein [Polaromonas sp. W10N]